MQVPANPPPHRPRLLPRALSGCKDALTQPWTNFVGGLSNESNRGVWQAPPRASGGIPGPPQKNRPAFHRFWHFMGLASTTESPLAINPHAIRSQSTHARRALGQAPQSRTNLEEFWTP
jgi:hypothetical protein